MLAVLLIFACSGDAGPAPDPSGDSGSLSVGASGITGSTGSTGDTGGGSPTDPCREGELQFAPGVGSYDVFPLQAGDVLTIIQGPQGGYHVDFAGVVSPVPDVGIILRPLLTLDDGVIVAGEDDVIQAGFFRYDEPTCTGEFSGTRMFVLSDASALCALVGRDATVSLQLEDFDGRSASTELAVTLDVDLIDPYTCATIL